MFDTLVYIPTILAYTFISLLVVILGFIVIYVSHKIYVTIYDNLPVAQMSSTTSSTISEKIKTMAQPSAIVGGQRKSKTALRIIVTLEPCYLAFLVFKATRGPFSFARGRNCVDAMEISVPPETYASKNDGRCVVKYYDNLASIPTNRQL